MSAVIVTRGNVPDELERIAESLPYDELIVWDNSRRPEDARTYGRHLALAEAKHDVIYSQDDDILFEKHGQLMAAYEPGLLVGSMTADWISAAARHVPGGYRDIIFPGAGSLYQKHVVLDALERYLAVWPDDEFFRTWCDCVVGVLSPHKNLKLRHVVLPCARESYRVCRQPGAASQKREMILRARAIRDAA